MAIDQDIDELRRRADELETLRAEFPDLREYPTRWRKVLVSKAVNAKPEGAYTSHACGCCNDSPLYAWFYVQRGKTRVYSDPPFVCVGEKNPYYLHLDDELPDRWSEDWREKVAASICAEATAMLVPPRGATP